MSNNFERWFVGIATLLLMAWITWASSSIIDNKTQVTSGAVKVDEVRDTISDRLDRIEDKLDRMIERLL